MNSWAKFGGVWAKIAFCGKKVNPESQQPLRPGDSDWHVPVGPEPVLSQILSGCALARSGPRANHWHTATDS